MAGRGGAFSPHASFPRRRLISGADDVRRAQMKQDHAIKSQSEVPAPLDACPVQFGALPVRRTKDGSRILLVTSRETGRWIIPKGWPMAGKKPYQAAAQEALEEA